MRTLFVLAALAAAACTATEATQLAPREYEIRSDVAAAAVVIKNPTIGDYDNRKKADSLCPQGYSVMSERPYDQDGRYGRVWHIRCNP